MQRKVPEPTREEIIALRSAGLSREAIAQHYNVTLSRVKKWFRELNVPHNRVPTDYNQRKSVVGEAQRAMNLDDGLTLIDRARRVLGTRVSEDFRGYLLDGRPVRVDVLLRSAGIEPPKT